MATLPELLDSATFDGLTLWKTATGWQVSVTQDRVSWRVEQGPTPSLALMRALGAPSATPASALPPLPY